MARLLGALALTLLGVTILLSGAAQPAQAHGGGTPQLVNAAAGPYRVSAWTQPDPPRVGALHLSVAVSEPAPGAGEREAGQVVLDAEVRVQLQALDRPAQSITALASRQGSANKFLYEADLELPAEGQWRVQVQVVGPAGAGGAGFDLQVLPIAASPLLTLGWPVWAGLGLVLAATAWMIRAFQRTTAANGSHPSSTLAVNETRKHA